MSNRITLDKLDEMEVRGLESLPADQIAMLHEDVTALQARAKRAGEKMHAVMTARYSQKAAEKRGEPTGTVRLNDDGYVVVCDVPKAVVWDQAGLKQTVGKLIECGEEADDYVTSKLTVPESKFKAWPTGLREMFEPFRTVNVGRETFKIERAA